MPIEEAQKVIAEYAPAGQPETAAQKQEQTIPVALAELFENIQEARAEAQARRCTDLPFDENGDYILPDENECPDDITLEEYLSLKFPEATDIELHRDGLGKVHDDYGDFPLMKYLEDAFRIDCACAECTDPDNCLLPDGYRKGRNLVVPSAVLNTRKDGQMCLDVHREMNACIKCKHRKAKKQEPPKTDPAFEHRVKSSGLLPAQTSKTFESYDHEEAGAEATVAKAQAILVAKKQSNLVLAGKAGTGKTHLAVAVALEAMRKGREAIFRNVPELLEEIGSVK
jgi:hypothetical protein